MSSAGGSSSAAAERLKEQLKGARPQFQNAHDAAAFILHSLVLQRGATCVGLNEASAERKDAGVAPAGWNSTPHVYSFTYTHPSVANTFAMKAIAMEDELIVHAQRKDDKTVSSIQVNVSDYIDSSQLANYDRVLKDASLISVFTTQVLDKLVPQPAPSSSASQGPSPLREPPRAPQPDYDPTDPLRISRPQMPYFPRPGGDFDQDLNPFGAGLPYGPVGGPIGGGYPGGPGGLMGPNHPMFGPGGAGGFGGPGPMAPLRPGPNTGGGRGIRYDPPGPLRGFGEPNPDHMPPPGPPPDMFG